MLVPSEVVLFPELSKVHLIHSLEGGDREGGEHSKCLHYMNDDH